MVDLSLDVKCSITTAILSVLVYLLISYILKSLKIDAGYPLENDKSWITSMETIMLVSVFVGYNINSMLFNSCKL